MRYLILLLVSISFLCSFAIAEQPTLANTDLTYRQLRDISIGTDAVSVSNFVLKRDAATFTFKQGTFSFLSAVNGKVTGAVFLGDGEFTMNPPIASEQKSISILTRSATPGMTESFQKLVLRFTDNSYEEIKKGGTATQPPGNAFDVLHQAQNNSRNKIKTNYDGRILQDVLSSRPGEFFLAFISGWRYSDKMLFCIDPHGAKGVEPEEVLLETYDENKYGIWAAFHFSNEYSNGIANGTQTNSAFDIESQNLDTRLEKNGYLRGNALTKIISRQSDLRALNFLLFPTLRVRNVTDSAGKPLEFIQEDKDHDADYWVILPRGLAEGEEIQIRTVYDGKDAVITTGSGNYYPVARDDWYPNERFGRYSNYELKFSTPKKVQIVATGALVSESVEGDQNITVWKSEAPLPVAGFNLGDFKKIEAKLRKGEYTVECYANKEPPDAVKNLSRAAEGDAVPVSPIAIAGNRSTGVALGPMYTTAMMEKPLAEAQLSIALYTEYFGPMPFKRVSITQQTACNFGQSWPNLVYMPICSFFDVTVRHELGLDDTRGYWKTVAAHEVAHQWWGHTVGFNSYRDQWMSEGFSEFSASLFVQLTQKNNMEFVKLWKDQLELVTERNKDGFRAIDVGPLTGGYRLSNTRTGNIYQHLIYPKGSFILHMIRMMMSSPQKGDKAFQEMMHDFVLTYQSRAASTEDFKAIVEKHMTPGMDLEKNHKMDWFFNEYVYGTALPDYRFESQIGSGENGAVLLKFKITQSNVTDQFRMLVPVYLELADGEVIRLGAAPIIGNSSIERTVPLNGLKQTPKRAILNYQYDVLATGY